MEYTNQISQLNRTYFVSLIIFIICTTVVFGAFFFVKKIKVDQGLFPSNFENWNVIVRWISYIGLSILFVAVLSYSIRLLLDLPNVLSRKYVVDVCVITKQDSSGSDYSMEDRGVGCTSENNENNHYNLQVTYTPMKLGEKYKVIYLPNSKFGVIIEKMP